MNSKTSEVLKFKKIDPNMSCARIGLLVGLTRERVRQILSKNGVETGWPKRYCRVCGKRIKTFKSICGHCKVELNNLLVFKKCPVCLNMFGVPVRALKYHSKTQGPRKYCSNSCRLSIFVKTVHKESN